MRNKIPYILILIMLFVTFLGMASLLYVNSINDSLHMQVVKNLKKEKNELIMALAKNNKLYDAFKQAFPESRLHDKSK